MPYGVAWRDLTDQAKQRVAFTVVAARTFVSLCTCETPGRVPGVRECMKGLATLDAGARTNSVARLFFGDFWIQCERCVHVGKASYRVPAMGLRRAACEQRV